MKRLENFLTNTHEIILLVLMVICFAILLVVGVGIGGWIIEGKWPL